ncbi:uncharacterized protein LOC124704026 isoform X5 [Lolium rigidum]|nr:uncharacterized protein LOC124704026 isoform X5 [Lolium rigidum]
MFPLGSTQLHWTMVRLTRLLVLVETKISGTLGRAEHEKSKAAVDFLSLAELWEHFAESGAYGLAVLVRLLGHVLPLRHPAIHSHQPHHLQEENGSETYSFTQLETCQLIVYTTRFFLFFHISSLIIRRRIILV